MAFIKLYNRFAKLVFETIVDFFVKVLGICMVITILFQIFSRYVMPQIAVPWTDEISRFAFLWFSFLGSAYAMYKDVHFNVDFVAKKFHQTGRRILAIISRILTVLFALFLMYFGVQLVTTIGAMKSPYLHWPMKYFYSIMPITGALYFIDSIDWFLSEKRRHCVDDKK